MEKFLLGCDWGTSTFRLQLLDLAEQRVIGEVLSKEGIAGMHKAWQVIVGQRQTISKGQLFREHLNNQIAILSNKLSIDLDNVTIVISGMASSSIGMEDIPYSMIPFALDGSDATIKHLDKEEDFAHEIILISGVSSNKDVMRGEETQLVGILSLLEVVGHQPAEGILIFPGTHSKHIYIKNGELNNFSTFMTGELFNIMCNHSILKDSVQPGNGNTFSEMDAVGFKLGLQDSQDTDMLNGLFRVRTNQLFDKLNKKQNSYYLSGLLIGTEIGYLVENEHMPLLLCSGSNLYEFYKMALDELNLLGRTALIPIDLVDRAAVAGQHVIFQNYVLKELAK